MRNISFALTTAQIRARTKTVTRRLGWLNLKPGDHLMACEKCMGRKKGEPLVRLGVIEVVSVRRERLDAMMNEDDAGEYGFNELEREGLLEQLKTPRAFVEFFCRTHADCWPHTEVTRIEFRYV